MCIIYIPKIVYCAKITILFEGPGNKSFKEITFFCYKGNYIEYRVRE